MGLEAAAGMTFLYPEALLLFIPAALLWWKGPRGAGRFLRACAAALGILALAAPAWVLPHAGADLVVVVDRSASMPEASGGTGLAEIVRLAEDDRKEGDRVGIVAFGRRAAVERLPSEKDRLEPFRKDVGADASDLAAGLSSAIGILPEGRPGRILVLSDGEYQGPDPLPLAWEALARGIPVDFRLFARETERDAAVASIDLPGSVRPGEAFLFSAWVVSTHPGEAAYVLARNGKEISRGKAPLRAGRNRLLFRDRLWEGGVARYELSLSGLAEDREPRNDRARAVVRVEAEGGILLVAGGDGEGNLERSLAATGRSVRRVKAPDAALTLSDLDAFRAVILENVAASDLPAGSLESLARYVEGGGGLLLTGGRRSFGVGGYHRSPLDGLLPISMELRREHRKLSLALAVVLDRSGSMSATVPSGETKMLLADRGTAAAIDLLSPMDEVAVIAVDSSPHVIQPLAPLAKAPGLQNDVLRIESMGGGIFTYTGLVAGGKELLSATAGTRHIILFADAADAEEPGDYVNLLEQYQKAGITVSVIALGQEIDGDAAFLKDVAKRGGGQIYFTNRAEDLPRLFSQETISVARSAFVEGAVRGEVLPDARQMGELPGPKLPPLGGYNLTYLRDGAAPAIRTTDEYAAPLLAFWQRGNGRVAAFTGEADGAFTGAFRAWEGYASLFGTVANWLAGDDPPLFAAAEARREGHVVTAAVELDPEARPEWPAQAPVLLSIPEDPDLPVRRIPMTWEDDGLLVARYELADGETRHHRVALGSRVLRAPPVTLPYSPEHELRVGLPSGRSTLAEIAERTGGEERVRIAGLFEKRGEGGRLMDLSRWLAFGFLLLVVWEIAVRRLGLAQGLLSGWERGAALARPASAVPLSAPADAKGAPVGNGLGGTTPPPAPVRPSAVEGGLSALEEAKRRAQRRFGG